MKNNTYLLLWNPTLFSTKNITCLRNDIALRGNSEVLWGTGSRKNMKAGEKIYLLRTGKDPRGIIAMGIVLGAPFETIRFTGEKRKELKAPIRLLSMGDPENPVISMEQLKKICGDYNYWSPRGAGKCLDPEVARKLDLIWNKAVEDL